MASSSPTASICYSLLPIHSQRTRTNYNQVHVNRFTSWKHHILKTENALYIKGLHLSCLDFVDGPSKEPCTWVKYLMLCISVAWRSVPHTAVPLSMVFFLSLSNTALRCHWWLLGESNKRPQLQAKPCFAPGVWTPPCCTPERTLINIIITTKYGYTN